MDLTVFYQNYPKEKVDEAVAYLSYHDFKTLPKKEDPKHPILYVFRHGQTTDNADFLFSGWRDPSLTELGVEQTKTLAEKLKDKNAGKIILYITHCIASKGFECLFNGGIDEVYTTDSYMAGFTGNLPNPPKLNIQHI